MPIYEYACKSCGEHHEVSQSFSDEPLTICPACGGPLRKVFGSIGIAFKGSGFYRTDARSGAAKANGKGEKGEKGEGEKGEKGEKADKSEKSAKSGKAAEKTEKSGTDKSSTPKADKGSSSSSGGDSANSAKVKSA